MVTNDSSGNPTASPGGIEYAGEEVLVDVSRVEGSAVGGDDVDGSVDVPSSSAVNEQHTSSLKDDSLSFVLRGRFELLCCVFVAVETADLRALSPGD